MAVKGIKGGQLKVLTDDQLYQIHLATLEVLWEVGINVQHKKALEIMKGCGCKVSFDKERVYIPEHVLMKYIEMAPNVVTLYGKKREYDVALDDTNTVYTMSGAGSLWVLDLDGKRRPSTMQDLIDLTRLQDTFENFHIAHWLVQPQDIPQVGADRVVFATMLKNTLRPQHIIPGSPIGIEDHIEMAAVLAGSREEVLRRPTFFENVCLISPLVHRKDLIEEIMLCVKYKIPMIAEVDANAGGTTPFTIAGTVVEQNANILTAIMFSQMINPGTPCIYSSSSGILDMRDANYSGNCPEAALIHVAASQMAHYYHLPYQGANPSDSKIPDAQMGYERAHHFLTLALGGCNIIHVAIGNLEMMRLASYEQCVIDNEILGATFRIVEGIEITRDTLGIDVLKEVGPGGNFIGTDHTLKYLRRNRWQPKITDRSNWETWQAKGGKDIRQRANEEACRILTSHHPQYVTKSQAQEIDKIAKDAQKRAIEK